MGLRKEFNPPPYHDRVRFRKFRDRNPEFDKLFKETQRLKMAKHRLNPINYKVLSEKQRSYTRLVKQKLFEILGGKKCVSCGITDERVLQFDHIDGGGRQDVKRFTGHLDRLRAYYTQNPKIARMSLQIHCANCNQIRKHELNQNTYQY